MNLIRITRITILHLPNISEDTFQILVKPVNYDVKRHKIIVQVLQKNYTLDLNALKVKLPIKSPAYTNPLQAQLKGNDSIRVKAFIYDTETEKIVDARLQEFGMPMPKPITTINPTARISDSFGSAVQLEVNPIDELLMTVPVILGNWEVPKKEKEKKKLNPSNEKYYCEFCDDKITLEMIKTTIGAKEISDNQTKIINGVLPFINLYRKNFGLDTCLKKAHFIAQIAHESSRFSTLEEDEMYDGLNLTLGIFSKKEIEITETILESLKDNLTAIFSITDSTNKQISKTNDELKSILLNKKPKIVDGELYGYFHGKNGKIEKNSKPKLIFEALKEDKSVDYKIFIKQHKHFGVPLMSRGYWSYPGDDRGLLNGNELTRDGWKFKGRGLKQVTGRNNYTEFSKYRKKIKFTDDETGYIDFTSEKEGELLKGSYLKLSEYIYATQSAFWFWNAGTLVNKKHAVDYAEEDNFDMVCKCINSMDSKTNKAKRKALLTITKGSEVFNINRHYKLMVDRGNDLQKKAALDYLEQRKKSGDKDAEKILEEYNKLNPKSSEKK